MDELKSELQRVNEIFQRKVDKIQKLNYLQDTEQEIYLPKAKKGKK